MCETRTYSILAEGGYCWLGTSLDISVLPFDALPPWRSISVSLLPDPVRYLARFHFWVELDWLSAVHRSSVCPLSYWTPFILTVYWIYSLDWIVSARWSSYLRPLLVPLQALSPMFQYQVWNLSFSFVILIQFPFELFAFYSWNSFSILPRLPQASSWMPSHQSGWTPRQNYWPPIKAHIPALHSLDVAPEWSSSIYLSVAHS